MGNSAKECRDNIRNYVLDNGTSDTTSTKVSDNMQNISDVSDKLSSQLSPQKINLDGKELNKVTLQYTGISCGDVDTVVPGKNTEATFCMLKQNKKSEEMHDEKSKCVCAKDYVDFLDSLPFENDEVDEDDIDYYDSVINN